MREFVAVEGMTVEEGGAVGGFLYCEGGGGGGVDGHFVEEGCTYPIFRQSRAYRVEAHS